MTAPGPAARGQRYELSVLVSAESKYGATAEIAQAIGDVLAGHGFRATVLPPGNVSTVDGYDAVILGSAVDMGHWLAPAKEFVTRFRDALAARPVWLFQRTGWGSHQEARPEHGTRCC